MALFIVFDVFTYIIMLKIMLKIKFLNVYRYSFFQHKYKSFILLRIKFQNFGNIGPWGSPAKKNSDRQACKFIPHND